VRALGACRPGQLDRDRISDWWRGRTANKLLLLAGVGAVLVYALGDIQSGFLYDG
jgi:hypothetical protein